MLYKLIDSLMGTTYNVVNTTYKNKNVVKYAEKLRKQEGFL